MRRPRFHRAALASLLLAAAIQPLALGQEAPPTPAGADAKASEPRSYLQVNDAKDGTMSLAICNRSFRPASGKGPRVDLVGAVHIGDKAFYTELQRQLDASDVVLFEGVKPSGAGALAPDLDEAGKVEATRKRMGFLQLVVEGFRDRQGRFPVDIADLLENGSKRFKPIVQAALNDAWGRPFAYAIVDVPAEEGKPARQFARLTSLGADGKSGGEGLAAEIVVDGEPVAADKKTGTGRAAGNIQVQLAQMLDVSFQLDCMDSSKPNWRNSDIDIDELRKRLEAAGPGAAAILSLLDGTSFQAKFAAILIGFVSQSKPLCALVKVVVIDTLAAQGPGGLPKGLPGAEAMEEIILKDRNEIVLHDLAAIIANEPGVKSVAIFYGAGHMDDMERRLVSEMGYVADGERWNTAMTADPKAAGMTAAQVKQMRATMKTLLKGAR